MKMNGFPFFKITDVGTMILFILVLMMNACNSSNNSSDDTNTVKTVEIKKEDGSYKLYVDEEPYFIKGARTLGTRYMEKVSEYGGNSVRVGFSDIKAVLDKAENLGLTVMFGLPFKPERSGFDYDDEDAVQEQYKRMKEIVMKYKDHPAILLWAIGNELDHVPRKETYNLKMWNAVNDVAGMIHEIDPDHPAMTVIGTGRRGKLKDLKERCPDLDLLGINAYADISEVPDWLRKYDWNKPYAVTEWGPSGGWQVPKTKWGVPIEETSTEKADLYRENYEQVIKADTWCIGSYAFLWTCGYHVRTHTWYNMFFKDSLEKEAIDVMQYLWTNKWPANRAPRIESLMIDDMKAEDNVAVTPNSIHSAQVVVGDPDNEELRIEWELLPRVKWDYGVDPTKPEAIGEFIKIDKGKIIQFEAPANEGDNYRLFVYVCDNHGNVAVANIPFYVKKN